MALTGTPAHRTRKDCGGDVLELFSGQVCLASGEKFLKPAPGLTACESLRILALGPLIAMVATQKAAPATKKVKKKAQAPAAQGDASISDVANGLEKLGLHEPPRSVWSPESLARVRSFLLGTHNRAGVDSLVRKLPMDAIRKICEAIREPAVSYHHFALRDRSHVTKLGSIDLWVLLHGTHSPSGRRTLHSLRVVLQHVAAKVPGAVRNPVATRYFGCYDNYMKFVVEFDWTHKATGVNPALPPSTKAEAVHAKKLKAGQGLFGAGVTLAEMPKGSPHDGIDISDLAFEDGGVTIARKTKGQLILERCADSVGSSDECWKALVRSG